MGDRKPEVDQKAADVKPTATDSSRSTVVSLFKSFLKSFSFLGSAYALGYLGFSPSWILLAVAVWIARDKINKEKKLRRAIVHESINREKETILARLDDLPSWVFFPDVERAEWLNKILQQLWPYIGNYTHDLIRTSIESSIRDNLPSYLKSFKFETIILGDVPPRIGGVKVYTENVSRDEIVMDMEILYAGDCHFQIKVKSFRAGLKDLQIHGTIRVIMKPLVRQMPLVGGITVFFLNNPSIDFNLTNIADVLDMPGLSDTLRNVIGEQLGSYMVLPNKLHIPLIADLPSKILKFNPPAGVLQINVIEAQALRKADISLTGKGKSDPFVAISVGAQSFKSQVIDNSIDPYWNFFCEAIIDQINGQIVDLDVYDEDPGSKDDFLGCITLDVASIVSKGEHDTWVPLESAKTGEIHVKTTWKMLTDRVQDLKQTQKEISMEGMAHNLSSALLLVYVDSAKHLPSLTKTGLDPNPNVKLIVGKSEYITATRYKTKDPVWEECFQFLLSDPEVQELCIVVQESTNTKKTLGNLSFLISNLVKDQNTEVEQNFMLQDSGHDSSINLIVQLKFFKTCNSCDSLPVTPSDTTSGVTDLSTLASDQLLSDHANSSTNISDKSPVEEEIVTVLSANPVMSAACESQLRHRLVKSSSEDVKIGQVQLTLRYSTSRNKFVVVVHKAIDLVGDRDDLPDPYIKLYLLPDKNKDSKKRTSSFKNTIAPVFDETFEYMVNHSDLNNHTLQVIVISKSSGGVFSMSKKRVLGQVMIALCNLDLTSAVTDWYNLQPAIE